MKTELSKKFGIIAGDGELPVVVAKSAKIQGYTTVAISLSGSNKWQLSPHCEKIYSFGPGELQKILNTLKKENISELIFIGKVHKGLLFKNPRLDSRAINLMKQVNRMNDDKIMLTLIEELEKEGITVADQSIFLKELLEDQGVLGQHMPTEEQLNDIEYGFSLAKEMGRLDIGQSVVIQNKMVLAIEAIEGTDRAIERGCKLGNGSAVIVKVSKPKQDKRFDIPTVGLNTLKTMKKFGGKVLAVEANETFIVQKQQMIDFANKNKMVFIAV